MALDQVLVQAVLDVLGAMEDRGLGMDQLASNVTVRTGRNVTVQQVESAVTFAKLRGWLATRDDEWGLPRVFITTAGMNRLAQM